MRRYLLTLSLVVLSTWSLYAQETENCPCCSSAHQQFDFWIGDWTVYDTAGTVLGENTIISLEDGCLINEHWKGSKGSTGRSYNYYNNTDSTWNQLWVDNGGQQLELKGTWQVDRMILESELIPGQKIDFYKNRITWAPIENSWVSQQWDILDKNDKLLSTVFLGIYKPKEE